SQLYVFGQTIGVLKRIAESGTVSAKRQPSRDGDTGAQGTLEERLVGKDLAGQPVMMDEFGLAFAFISRSQPTRVYRVTRIPIGHIMYLPMIKAALHRQLLFNDLLASSFSGGASREDIRMDNRDIEVEIRVVEEAFAIELLVTTTTTTGSTHGIAGPEDLDKMEIVEGPDLTTTTEAAGGEDARKQHHELEIRVLESNDIQVVGYPELDHVAKASASIPMILAAWLKGNNNGGDQQRS
ncbi:hypothetical protein EV182_008130, partial [Spiromyces aspiralis]